MARKPTMTDQLNNMTDFNSRFRQMKTLAKNVFGIKGIEQLEAGYSHLTQRYLNQVLLYNAAIAFYEEPDVGVIALPFLTKGRIDIYGEPIRIQCYAENGRKSRVLKPGEYVIMYDNTEKISILPEIRLYAQRMSMTARTSDINISQQRTPRIITGPKSLESTLKDTYNKIDVNEDVLYFYKDFDIDSIQTVLAPAPYVADKLDDHQDKIWNEFCRLIGISDLSIEKKERILKDELRASQGGSIASRYSRYTPRKEAVDRINEMFADYLDTPLEVEYYDHVPGPEDLTGGEEDDFYEE